MGGAELGRLPRIGVWQRIVEHRWQLLILALGGVGGVVQLLGASPPSRLAALLPAWIVTGWAAMLTVGCVVGAVALLWPLPALLRVGMTLLCAATAAYWTAIVGTVGWVPAVALGWPILALGACALCDVIVVTSAVRRSRP